MSIPKAISVSKSQKNNQSKKPKAGIQRITKLPTFPAREIDAHKGTFGKVLVIAGSREMLGAACLATQAALRSGAGLVTLACPASIQLHAAAICMCATSIPLPESKSGMIDPDKATRFFQNRGYFDAATSPSVIAAGPGIGQFDRGFAAGWISLIKAFDRSGHAPIVLDADGLNALAVAHPPADGNIQWPFSANFVITPHPGEMGRLCGISTAAVQAAREYTAVSAAQRINELANIPFHNTRSAQRAAPAVVVLKGAGTIVTNGRTVYKNTTGNPGMATGGTGDVLTGMIAGLIAQGMSRLDAAIRGTYLHGLAGDAAAARMGEGQVIASDLLDHITLDLNEERLQSRQRRPAKSVPKLK